MIKNSYLAVIFACQTLATTQAFAGVNFILNTDDIANQSKDATVDGEFARECRAKGFSLRSDSCSGNEQPGLLCPLSPDYTDACCSARYAYVIPGQCSGRTIPSSDTCGGRYRCICSETEYPKGPGRETCTGKFSYNEINYCAERYYDADGASHETRYYTGCMCSSSYAKCNSSYRLHGTGDSCVFNGDVYYASCACDAGYNKRCEKTGAKYSKDYCLFNRVKYYTECNGNEADDKSDSDTVDSVSQ